MVVKHEPGRGEAGGERDRSDRVGRRRAGAVGVWAWALKVENAEQGGGGRERRAVRLSRRALGGGRWRRWRVVERTGGMRADEAGSDADWTAGATAGTARESRSDKAGELPKAGERQGEAECDRGGRQWGCEARADLGEICVVRARLLVLAHPPPLPDRAAAHSLGINQRAMAVLPALPPFPLRPRPPSKTTPTTHDAGRPLFSASRRHRTPIVPSIRTPARQP